VFTLLLLGTQEKGDGCARHRGKQEEEGDFIEILDSR